VNISVHSWQLFIFHIYCQQQHLYWSSLTVDWSPSKRHLTIRSVSFMCQYLCLKFSLKLANYTRSHARKQEVSCCWTTKDVTWSHKKRTGKLSEANLMIKKNQFTRNPKSHTHCVKRPNKSMANILTMDNTAWCVCSAMHTKKCYTQAKYQPKTYLYKISRKPLRVD